MSVHGAGVALALLGGALVLTAFLLLLPRLMERMLGVHRLFPYPPYQTHYSKNFGKGKEVRQRSETATGVQLVALDGSKQPYDYKLHSYMHTRG